VVLPSKVTEVVGGWERRRMSIRMNAAPGVEVGVAGSLTYDTCCQMLSRGTL
jgi:hypothetical protein